MKAVYRSAGPRRGFSLIELLVVIAIIGIIIGLLSVAVMRALVARNDTQNLDDMRFLDTAANKFKTRYGIYPPSRILLSNDPKKYQSADPAKGGDPLGPWSWSLLQKIWPRLDIGTSYDWSNGTMQVAGLVDGQGNYAVTLEGDQCLVFFLGGLPVNSPGPGSAGFGDSDKNPTILTGKKVPPFFAFTQTRLVQRNPKHTFFSYKDGYEVTPFAYFSTYGGKLGTYSDTDCATLGVAPYFQGWHLVQKKVVPYDPSNSQIIKKYFNAEGVQIVSAGRDNQFGPGGEWSPTVPNVPAVGRDDQSNFHEVNLGTAR